MNNKNKDYEANQEILMSAFNKILSWMLEGTIRILIYQRYENGIGTVGKDITATAEWKTEEIMEDISYECSDDKTCIRYRDCCDNELRQILCIERDKEAFIIMGESNDKSSISLTIQYENRTEHVTFFKIKE